MQRMTTITIDVECKDGIITKHFCTVVCSASEIHKALMDSLSFIKAIGWTYIGHDIIVHGQRENVFDGVTEE